MTEDWPWQRALVTGASAGIGEAYLKLLAPRCSALTAVARRGERLEALASELAPQCEVSVLEADLMSTEGQARVVEHLRQQGPFDLLVNNAGYASYGAFAGADLDAEIGMLRLHQEATLTLTRAALPGMLHKGRGAVINVASLGAFSPMPRLATYGASKAFLLSFSQSLAAELRDSGVTVQCLCPGYTRTEIHSRDSFAGFDASRVPEALWMEPDAVVAESLAALRRGQLLVIPAQRDRELARDWLRGLSDLVAEEAPQDAAVDGAEAG